jgi:methyl-accepting chemotaxis protein
VSKAASQIASGDLDIHLDIHQKDEIGQMATDFQRMAEYLVEMANTAQKVSQGDLTMSVTPQSDKDRLGNAFVDMIANLRSLVSQVVDNASGLSAASSQLASAAGQAGQATNQISTTIQQVAQGTSQQANSVTQTAQFVEEMSRTIDKVARGTSDQAKAVDKSSEITAKISTAIERVANNAKSGVGGSEQAARVAQEGAAKVTATVNGMNAIREKVNVSAEKVQEMGKRSEQIGVIVEAIEDIASQTNLLALNAAIEAARAGEHGKGFAVVADEVRKLAERASSSTKEISGLIRGIQQIVSEAVTAMGAGAAEVENGVAQANESGQALGNVLKAVQSVSKQVAEIAEAAQQMTVLSNELVTASDAVLGVVQENTQATEKMSSSSGEVTRAIENIASVGEENSAAVEEVSASTEEMSAQVEEVGASAQSLSEMAEALQQAVSQFKVSAEQQVNHSVSPAKPSHLRPVAPSNGNGKNGHGQYQALPTLSVKGR